MLLLSHQPTSETCWDILYLSQVSSLAVAAAAPLTALVALKAAAAAAGNSLGILSNTPAVGEAGMGYAGSVEGGSGGAVAAAAVTDAEGWW